MTVSTKHFSLLILPMIACIGLVLAVNYLDPAESVASIMLVFLLLYSIIASSLFIFIKGTYWVRQKIGRQGDLSKGVFESKLYTRRAYYVASVVAFAPILLLGMQSLNQTRIQDVLLVLALVGLASFYVVRRTC